MAVADGPAVGLGIATRVGTRDDEVRDAVGQRVGLPEPALMRSGGASSSASQPRSTARRCAVLSLAR